MIIFALISAATALSGSDAKHGRMLRIESLFVENIRRHLFRTLGRLRVLPHAPDAANTARDGFKIMVQEPSISNGGAIDNGYNTRPLYTKDWNWLIWRENRTIQAS